MTATVASPQNTDVIASDRSASKVPYGWLLLAICALVFFTNLWGYPLFDVDEPRYAQAAREMLQRADWITPYFNWQLRFDKPPFHYWAIASVYQVLGVTEGSARLVSALAATLMAFAVYVVGAFGVGGSRQAGFWSAAIFATGLEVIALAHMSITDMDLSLWMTLTTLALWGVASRGPKWWLAAGAFAAVGMLTKGPVAIVLPGGVLVVYALLTQRLKQTLLTPYLGLALIIAVVPFLLWCWAAYQANGQIFLDALYHHNVSRFSGGVAYHPEPWWYFFPVLVGGFFPWIVTLPAAVRAGWKSISTAKHIPEQALTLFAAVWAVLVFVFFTIAKTKLLTYVLPMFPALGLWVGSSMVHHIPKTVVARHLAWGMGFLALLGSIALVVAITVLPDILPQEARYLVTLSSHRVIVALLVLGLATASILAYKQRPVYSMAATLMTMVVVTVGAMLSIVPNVNALTMGDMLLFVDVAGEAPLASYEITRPSLTYYTNRPIPSLARGDNEALSAFTDNAETTYVITKANLVEDFKAQLPVSVQPVVLPKGNVYRLLRLER